MALESKRDQNLLRDLRFDADFKLTPTGDLLTVSGRANLKQAVYNRLITVPGALVHRPEYGIGIKRFQGAVGSLAKQREIAILIKDQLELDARITEVTGVRITPEVTNPALFTIRVQYDAVGFGTLTDDIDPFELTI